MKIVATKTPNYQTREITYEFYVEDIPSKEGIVEDDAGEVFEYSETYLKWSPEFDGDPQIIASEGQEVSVFVTAWCDVIHRVDGEEDIYTEDLETAEFSEIATLPNPSPDPDEPEPDPEPPTPPVEPEVKFEHPGIFTEFNFDANTIICSENGLSAAKVDRWCNHCEKYLSWVSQTDMTDAASHCKVKSGDLITASWYNKCADLCGVSHVEPNALITADLFRALGAAISKEE